MFLRPQYSDKKTKLVYSNRPSHVHFSCPFSYGSNWTAHKTHLALSIEAVKAQGS